MKMNNKWLIVTGSLLVTLFLAPALVNAQTPEDPGGDPDAPIDGGVTILVAAGVGYGIKKARDSRKKTITDFKQ